MGATATSTRRNVHVWSLLKRLAEARLRADDLFAIVKPDAIYDRPIPERHRIIFYLGHLEAFDWNLLRERLKLATFAPALDRLFAFGIDPVDGGLPADQPEDWPTRPEVEKYKQSVRDALDEALGSMELGDSAVSPSAANADLAQLLDVAIEHRLMHAETLTYMLHQLPIARKFHIEGAAAPVRRATGSRMVEIPAGDATLGLPREQNGPFGWDNEFLDHRVAVPAFRIDAENVTNRDFLSFVEAGGYDERSFWTDADWEWRKSSGISHPAFWTLREGKWLCRTMFADAPLPLDWPASVSHAEASAYARWAGKELPTEAEWHRATYGTPHGDERSFPWGEELPDASRGNFNFERWDPTPVGAFPAGDSAFGISDLLGNGWEWTSTPFAPFAGFEPFSFYPGYSANFFDNKHYVMKGGSARTASCMLRRSFRNWFQPHYQYVYASFRCVER